jgi:riboflavin synthase alpha subunit
MFTGIVREVGRLESVRTRGGVTLLEIDTPGVADELHLGDSLAVNGICLTVARLRGSMVGVDATAETRRVSTLPLWRAGEVVHLEAALRTGEPLGGHFVLGHVDGTGRIVRLRRRGGAVAMTVKVGAALAARLSPKGSIAVDGVSLTLDAGPFPGCFTATLVPHTLRSTRFGRIKVGDLVNIELDVLAKAAALGSAPRLFAARPAAEDQRQGHPNRETQKRERTPLTIPSILARGWEHRRRHAHGEPRGRT